MRRKLSFKKVMLFGVGFLIAYPFLCLIIGYSFLKPSRNGQPLPLQLNEVFIKQPAGDVPTWVTRNLATAHTVIIASHGYGGSRNTWVRLMLDFNKGDVAVVAPSMPGQDASPENMVGFGTTESDCIVRTVAWVRSQRPDHPKIVLLGVSMGGSASWLASHKDPSVDGVITEGAYANFSSAIKSFLEMSAKGASVYLAPATWFAERIRGIKISSVRPVEAAAEWKGRPCMVIQADHDRLIERDQAEKLAAASGAQTWYVPNATHANCLAADRTGYEKRILDFIAALPPSKVASPSTALK